MKKRKNGYYETQKTFTIEGKKIQHTFYYKTKTELSEKEKAFKAEQTRIAKHYFSAVAEAWKNSHWEEISVNTRISYVPAYNRVVKQFGDIPVAEITAIEIQQFIDKLATKQYAKQTVKVHRIILNLIFKYAMLYGYIQFNPVEPTKIPRQLKKSKRELPSDEDIQKVIDNVDSEFGFFAFFLLFTGCRKGEALALQHRDIDIPNRRIHIHKTIVYSEQNQNTPIVQQSTKTESGDRYIYIPDILLEKLPSGDKNNFLFGGENPYTKQQFRKRWEKYKSNAEINFTPHQLRHAYATLLYEANVKPKDAQQLMGHSSIQVTNDIYTHISQERVTLVSKQLDERISQILH